MASEGEAEEVEHFRALGKVGVEAGGQAGETVIAVIVADEAEVVADAIGLNFGAKSMRDVEVAVETQDYCEQRRPRLVTGG